MNSGLEPQEPARHLSQALAHMSWSVEEEEFALIGFHDRPTETDLALLARPPCQLVREEDETTLLIHASDVSAVLARHPQARVERDLAWIRFAMPMEWEVVGFLARVTSALAGAGIPLGVVCSFSRDHLFLRRRYLDSATHVLDGLFPKHPPRS